MQQSTEAITLGPRTSAADFVLASEAHDHPDLCTFFRNAGSVAWFLRTSRAKGMEGCVTHFAGRPYIHVPTFTRLLLDRAGTPVRRTAAEKETA